MVHPRLHNSLGSEILGDVLCSMLLLEVRFHNLEIRSVVGPRLRNGAYLILAAIMIVMKDACLVCVGLCTRLGTKTG